MTHVLELGSEMLFFPHLYKDTTVIYIFVKLVEYYIKCICLVELNVNIPIQ